MPYRIRLIGVAEPHIEGLAVTVPVRSLALLTYLEQRKSDAVSRATLCRLLWPGKPESKARHSLSQLLYRTDQLMPGLELGRSISSLRCPATISTDVSEFKNATSERAAEILLTIGSSSIVACPLANCQAFEDWWVALGAAVDERARRVLKAYGLACAERGDNLRAIELLRMLLTLGEVHQDVANSYIGAIAAAKGLEAGQAEWMALSAAPEAVGQPLIVPPILTNNIADGPDAGPPLVGRASEFQLLKRKLATTQTQRCELVTILGEAGIGKTRLIQQLERLAAIKGVKIVPGKAHAAEQYLPFSAVSDMLANGLRARDMERIPPQWRSLLVGALPGITKQPAHSPEAPPEFSRTQLTEAIAVAIESICDAGSVLLRIDDFQWADQSSVEAISYLRRRLADAPVLIVLGARGEDLASNTHAQELVFSESTDQSTLVHLGPLEQASSAELLDTLLQHLNATIDDETRNVVLEQTNGRPFYILESIRHVQQEGKFREFTFDGIGRARPVLSVGSIDAYVASRLRRLPKEHLNVVSAISVLGRHATPAILEAVLEIGGMALALALADLEARGLIASSEDRLTFTHDILHDAAYRLTSSSVRKLIHGRAASELSRSGAASDGVLAIHFSKAGNFQAAYRHALGAAHSAELGFGEWEYFWNLALRSASTESESRAAREGLLRACLRAQRYTDAETHAAVLAPYYAEIRSDAGELLVTTAKLGASMTRAEVKASEVLQRIEDAIVMAQRTGQLSSWLESSNLLLISAHFAGRSEVADRWAATLLHAAAGASARTRVRLSTVISHVYGYQGRLEDCERLTLEGLEIAQDADPETQTVAHRGRGAALYFSGQLDGAEFHLGRALQLANASCSYLAPRVENDLAICYFERGSFAQALAMLNHALACDTAADTRPTYLANLAIAQYELGDYAQCQATVHELLRANEKLDSPWIRYAAHAIGGLAAMQVADRQTAEYSAEVAREYMDCDNTVLLGGDQVVAVFLCRFLHSYASAEEALAVAERSLHDPQSRLPLPRLRLLLEKSRILKSTAPDTAWRLAKDVRDEAHGYGAWAIVKMADEILESIPHV